MSPRNVAHCCVLVCDRGVTSDQPITPHKAAASRWYPSPAPLRLGSLKRFSGALSEIVNGVPERKQKSHRLRSKDRATGQRLPVGKGCAASRRRQTVGLKASPWKSQKSVSHLPAAPVLFKYRKVIHTGLEPGPWSTSVLYRPPRRTSDLLRWLNLNHRTPSRPGVC